MATEKKPPAKKKGKKGKKTKVKRVRAAPRIDPRKPRRRRRALRLAAGFNRQLDSNQFQNIQGRLAAFEGNLLRHNRDVGSIEHYTKVVKDEATRVAREKAGQAADTATQARLGQYDVERKRRTAAFDAQFQKNQATVAKSAELHADIIRQSKEGRDVLSHARFNAQQLEAFLQQAEERVGKAEQKLADRQAHEATTAAHNIEEATPPPRISNVSQEATQLLARLPNLDDSVEASLGTPPPRNRSPARSRAELQERIKQERQGGSPFRSP